MTPTGLVTAGVRVAVREDAERSVRRAVESATGERLRTLDGPPDLVLDHGDPRPSTQGLAPVTRGVWGGPDGMLLQSAGGSGYVQRWALDPLRVSSAWAPSLAEAGAAQGLRQRHRALRGQVLLHHPVLWSSVALHGTAPLHVSVVEVLGVPVLLAGPGGVGKSSLVADALAHGARATCDNLGVTDGRTVHGLVEPLRLPASVGDPRSSGSRAAHGRREHAFTGRVAALTPALVVVVRRDDHGRTRVRPLTCERAARALVAGTYAAGELQRFWPLVAHLALAGLGPVHPPVAEAAASLTDRLPCVELTLGRPDPRRCGPGGRLATLLGPELTGLERPPEATGPAPGWAEHPVSAQSGEGSR